MSELVDGMHGGTRSAAWKWSSLAAFVVLALAAVGLIERHAILASNLLAAVVQILSVLLMVWARLTFGRRSFYPRADPTAGGLVTTGPYRFLRHPIYAAVLYFLWAGAVSHASVGSIALAVLAAAAAAVRIAAEERLLIERYPEYCSYAARTKRVIPFIL